VAAPTEPVLEDERPTRSRVTSAVAWAGTERLLNRTVTLALFVVLGRLLEPADFGLVALATIVTSFLSILVDQGFSKALVQREHLSALHLDTAFWAAIATAGVLTAAGVAGAPLVGMAFGEPRLVPVVQVLSLGFLIKGLTSTQQALLERGLAMRTLAARRLTATVVGGATGIALALAGAGVWSLVAQALTTSAVGAVVLWSTSSWRPRFRASAATFRQLLSFGLNMAGIDVLGFLSRQGDNLLVGAVLGPTALGYYTVGYRVLLVVLEIATGTLSAVTMPTFSRLQHHRADTLRAFYAAVRLSQAVALPAFLGLAALAPSIVAVLFGPGWAPSGDVMRALAVVGLVQSSTYFDRGVLLAAGRQALELRITLLATVGNLVAFAVALPWGIVAVAVAFALRNLLFWPIRIAALRRVLGVDPAAYLTQWLRPLAAAALMGGVLLAVQERLGPQLAAPAPLALCVLGGALLYVASLRVLAPGVLRELLALIGGALRSLVSRS